VVSPAKKKKRNRGHTRKTVFLPNIQKEGGENPAAKVLPFEVAGGKLRRSPRTNISPTQERKVSINGRKGKKIEKWKAIHS